MGHSLVGTGSRTRVYADMGTIAPRWGLETRLDWWSHSESVFTSEASLSDITLGARTKYQFPTTHPNLQPFVGAGLGLHFLSMKVEDSSLGLSMDDSETRAGFDFGGGLMTHVNPSMDLTAEGWYSIVSDFNQFSLRVGVSRAFGN